MKCEGIESELDTTKSESHSANTQVCYYNFVLLFLYLSSNLNKCILL